LARLGCYASGLLALLASHSGQVVTRDEIQGQLRGNDTFIDFEQGVNKCIKQIRTALSDNPDNPLYLGTIPRRGYRFLAPVRTKISPPQVRDASSGLIKCKSGGAGSRRVEAASHTVPCPRETGKETTTAPTPPKLRLSLPPAEQSIAPHLGLATRSNCSGRAGVPVFYALRTLTCQFQLGDQDIRRT
jgi:DNA-binding winged helix-turn-helix (wHTH) protein